LYWKIGFNVDYFYLAHPLFLSSTKFISLGSVAKMPPGIFKVKLNNGLEMPVLGLSTGQVCLFNLKIFIYLQAV
jgi:hypothetical protein